MRVLRKRAIRVMDRKDAEERKGPVAKNESECGTGSWLLLQTE
uniref:Uncharacterized protein n=1 Tax=Rhizobium rhizogenes TaxID=359 RepID=A0A7S4ZRK5_RHIRH|nr:hypothetical protein pC5.7c_535 [Rhizobium rhizogenes]QCL09572.1 hypothetical protein pC5.8a_80 [Rhizobium rhizogenes]